MIRARPHFTVIVYLRLSRLPAFAYHRWDDTASWGAAMGASTAPTDPQVDVDDLDIRYGWSQAVSLVSAHHVPEGAAIRLLAGRPIGDGPCGRPGYVDEVGHASADLVERCVDCTRWLAGECLSCHRGRVPHSEDYEPGVTSRWESVCRDCSGTGRRRGAR
jgi:hypothetical protein